MMQELVERLAKAQEPTEALFIECYFAVFGIMTAEASRTDERWNRFIRLVGAEAWTDAALTLAGEWDRLTFERTGKTWGCYLGGIDTNAATPAIALCIAVLRALMAVDAAGRG